MQPHESRIVTLDVTEIFEDEDGDQLLFVDNSPASLDCTDSTVTFGDPATTITFDPVDNLAEQCNIRLSISDNHRIADHLFTINYLLNPTVSLSTTANPVTNSTTIPFTATFSGSVTDFELGDITVTGTANGGTPAASNLAGSGTEYTFDVVRGTTDGTVTVSIAAGTVTSGGVDVTASNEITVEIDTARPTAALSAPSITNSTTIPFTVTFSEDVTGFTDADFALGGINATNIQTVDARTYTFDIVHSEDDATISGTLPENLAVDAAENGNLASDSISVIVDRIRPTPTITTTTSTVINADTVPFTVTFDENVNDFVIADITVTGTANNGTLTATDFVAADASTYTFNVAGISSDGDVTVSIAADVATDLAGNNNVASPSSVTVTIDTIVPTVTITPADGTRTSDNPVTFTATFSEDVQNFELDDITVTGTVNGTNPTAANFATVDARTYTFDVARGSSDGTVIPSIAADVATDLAGNSNTASAPVTVTIDTEALTVSVTTTAGDTTNLATVPFTVTFGKAVEDFELADITVEGTANGGTLTASNFAAVDARTYTFNVAGIASDGTVIVSIAADVATDDAENTNVASTPVTVTIDTIVPTVTITPADGTRTSDNPVTFTATFSEDVQNFILDDITVTGTVNGTNPAATNFETVNARTYTFDVARGSSDGTVIPSIAADVATDLAGNSNTASAPVTVTIDTEALIVSVITTAGENTNLDTVPFRVTFNKPVADFELSDITVTGTANDGTPAASNLAGSGNQYTFDVVRGNSDGTVIVSIAADVATDAAGNLNTAFTSITVTIDSEALTANVTTTAGESTNLDTVPFTVTFNKAVEDFELADITVTGTANNGTLTASGFVGDDARTYTFNVADISSDGTVIVSIAADVATDAAGNLNTASTQVTVTVDTTDLTVSVATTAGDNTNLTTIPFTVTFNKAVADFELSDITVTGTVNGSAPAASNLVGSGAQYTFDVLRGTSDGTVTVSIAADVATDAAGNSNLASPSSAAVTIDTTDLTASVATTADENTALATVPFTVTFNKAVEDFDASDITVTGTANDGTPAASNLAGSGTDYTFDVLRGNSDGTVTVSIAADVATDIAGNLNTASTQVTVTVDTTAPTVTITPDDGTTTSDDPVTFTATFSEDVQNFVLADITITGTANGTNPTAANFTTVDARTYNFDVARGSSDGTVIASIAAGVATDLAANPNEASAPVTVTIDTVRPTVTLSSNAGANTNSNTITFTATFSRDVVPITTTDITIEGDANGGTLTATNIQTVDASTYTFDVAGIASDGTVIAIAAGVTTDLAGNSNLHLPKLLLSQ